MVYYMEYMTHLKKSMGKIRHEVKQSESSIVLLNGVSALHQYYKGCLDDETNDILLECIGKLEKIYYKDYISHVDVKEVDIVERLVYDDGVRKVKASDFKKVSYYELLSFMDSGLIPKRVALTLMGKCANYYFSDEDKSYILEDVSVANTDNNTSSFDTYLKDSLTDIQCFEKNITIIDTY